MTNEADDETGNENKAALNYQLSMPSRHQDPFAVREGKTLLWKDINMKLVSTMMLLLLRGCAATINWNGRWRDRRLILASFSLVSMLDSSKTTAH